METIWTITADGSRARIFETSNAAQSLREIENFDNPEGRAHNRELISDAQGRYFGRGDSPRAHAAAPKIDAVEHETELFAKTVSEYLDRARVKHRYDKLRLVAPAKFLGLLRKNLSKEAQKLIDTELTKNLSGFAARDIETHLRR